MNCPRCGMEPKSDGKYCEQCGEALPVKTQEAQAPSQAIPGQYYAARPARPHGMLVCTIIACVPALLLSLQSLISGVLSMVWETDEAGGGRLYQSVSALVSLLGAFIFLALAARLLAGQRLGRGWSAALLSWAVLCLASLLYRVMDSNVGVGSDVIVTVIFSASFPMLYFLFFLKKIPAGFVKWAALLHVVFLLGEWGYGRVRTLLVYQSTSRPGSLISNLISVCFPSVFYLIPSVLLAFCLYWIFRRDRAREEVFGQ